MGKDAPGLIMRAKMESLKALITTRYEDMPRENVMAYGTEQRMWTLEEYIEKYEQLQAENKKLKENAVNHHAEAAKFLSERAARKGQIRIFQAENKRLKEELESMLYQFAGWNDTKGGFTTDGLSALESAFDTLGWNDPHIHKFSQCDEPGCKKRGTCGWGPKGKRRHTCSTHYIEATRKEE